MKGQMNSLTIGRDRKGEQPLVGALDELRFSSQARYLDDFDLAETFSHNYSPGATPRRTRAARHCCSRRAS